MLSELLTADDDKVELFAAFAISSADYGIPTTISSYSRVQVFHEHTLT